MYWLTSILILPYFFIILNLYRTLSKIKKFQITINPGIPVSVVVACRDEEKNISTLLENLARQSYPPQFLEVVIVNDNSRDNTAEAARGFAGILNVRIIENNGKGKKQALRTGINAANNELIITTDADCSMGENWVKTVASYYEQYHPDMIISPVAISSGKGFFGKFQELEFLSLQGITAASALEGKAVMCNGANLAFTKQKYLLYAGNLHDELDSGDDIFLLHSIKSSKESEILWLESTDALVTTFPSPTLRTFLNQRKRWISKVSSYTDKDTIFLGIVTFIAITLELAALGCTFFNFPRFPVFLLIFILKSIPDYLILSDTASRYDNKQLMRWFLPVSIIYPFYVAAICLRSLIRR